MATVALAPWLVVVGASPTACPVGPIEWKALNAAIAVATPTSRPDAVPAGERPGSAAETRALRALMDDFVACSDAGEPLRVLALSTDRYLGSLYYRTGSLTAGQYASLARPDPADPDERTELLDVRRVERLADGRVVGEVWIRYAVIPEPKRFLVTIAQVDGVWRIDDILGELTFALP